MRERRLLLGNGADCGHCGQAGELRGVAVIDQADDLDAAPERCGIKLCVAKCISRMS